MTGGFWCEGRYASPVFLQAASQLLEFAALAVAVALDAGPVGAAAAFLAGRLCGLLGIRIALYRAAPWVRYGRSHASRVELRRLTSPSLASLAFPAANALNIHGMRIVVGMALGPAAVAVFSSIRTLSRIAMQITAMIARLLEPEMALAFGAQEGHTVRSMFRRSCQAAFWLGGLACIALGAIGEPFLAVWTHGQVAMDWSLFALLLASALAYALWGPALMVPYATNRHQRTALFYFLVYGVAVIALGYAGIALFGLAGAGIAILAAEVAVAMQVIPAVMSMSGENWKTWARVVASPPWYLAGK
jgi:O-antigen/teichoic acid export membrane protein